MKNSNKKGIGAVVVCVLVIGVAVFAIWKTGGFSNLKGMAGSQSASVYGAFVESNNFAILAGSTITNTGNTVITGDLGLSPGTSITGFFGTTANDGPGIVTGTIHQTDATASSAQTALSGAYTATATESCTHDLSGQDLGGMTLTPGVYCFTSSAQLTGTLTLNSQGDPNAVFIFQIGSTLTTASGSSVVFTGSVGSSCNVFWQVATSATLGSTTTFVGNIFALTAISTGNASTVNGRLLARNAAVTLNNTAVSAPICTAPVPVPISGGTREGEINVVKVVINDNGGTKKVADFPLFVNGMRVLSGQSNTFSALIPDVYTVTETSDPNYIGTFSGDCGPTGKVILNPGDTRYCILTNNDIGAPAVAPVPPLIDVVKVPNPLALPNGPGEVVYTYTLRNMGTVPVTNITMVGDSCAPITLVSGDTDNDSKLGVSEVWTYRCSTILPATHTNIITATGWANGISAVDIASATVVVGAPLVPPLIHVTKVPSPLALSAAGGIVTYTEKITNPGTVPLGNVTLVDDKCAPMKYISGDANSDSKLDPAETWTYTCRSNLSKTTTNTAVAEGTANGITVRDFAIATVIVASPGLPNTGFPPLYDKPTQ